MRSRDIIIFITLVLLIYSAACTFLYFKGASAFSGIMDNNIYTALFITVSVTFIAGKLLERVSSSVIADILNVIGGFWLSFMLYSVIIIIAADLLRLVLELSGIIIPGVSDQFRQYSYLIAFGLTILIIIAGFLNTVSPVTKKYRVTLNKPAKTKEIRIAAVSDIHLGSVLRKRSMRVLSRKLEALAPDMVLFLGDLIDGEIGPVIRDDLLDSLKIPESVKYVFAITGNHEYIGGHSKTIPYIESKGIRILLDEVVTLEEGVQLAGRKDRDSQRYTGQQRKDLADLLEGTDSKKPVIVLDHQPPLKNDDNIASFDIMLSGHTHNGQMWPLNYLTARLYKISYGHRKIDGTHHIVSSGYGTWGPRVRLGSRSELIDISLTFNNQMDD
ncbi:MAG: metallophosphoesterase [Bacteroidales bacterium]|nr:metallophosphoesterase [Bacteroidales bacterium]